jgi:hypothetical protein
MTYYTLELVAAIEAERRLPRFGFEFERFRRIEEGR